MKPNIKTCKPAVRPLFQAIALLLSAGLVAAGCAPEAPAITCGADTILDKKNSKCIVNPNFNIIVDDFKLGDFQLSQVDVPESMQVGAPETRRLDIKNVGTARREAVLIRYGISPVMATIQELRDRLANLDAATPIDVTVLGQVIITNLEPGEKRTVDYFLSVPNTVREGLYGFYFSVDEIPLVKVSETEFRPDFTAPGMSDANGTLRLPHAALVHAPATMIVGKPDKPNLRVLFAKTDNASFELDKSERAVEKIFTISARMSAQALNVTEAVTAEFDLKLPGHVIDQPGKDLGEEWFTRNQQAIDAAPEETTYKYDANRTFKLLMDDGSNKRVRTVYDTMCRAGQPTGDGDVPIPTEECAVIFNEDGRDAIYQLHLGPADQRLLGLTRKYPTFNPALDTNGEIKGTLVYRLATTQAEYQNNLADNVLSIPVVFMAPVGERGATDTDKDNAGVPGMNSALTAPYPFVLRNRDDNSAFGNDWFGAGYRVQELNAVDRRNEIAVSNYRGARASLYGKLLKLDRDIVSLSGHADWSTQRPLTAWQARANLGVFGFTVLNAEFSPNWCQKDAEVTYCPLFEAEPGAAPKDEAAKDATETPKEKKKKGRSVKWEKEFRFMAGPVPLLIEASAGLGGGVTFSGKFLMDETGAAMNKPPYYGVEFALGPYATLEASIFGGVSIGLARAGVQGTLTIVRLEFTPLIRPKARLSYDSTNSCFRHAEFSIDYEGPIKLTGPSGSVSIVAFLGVKICFFKCWKAEIKVLDITIAKFSSFEKTWNVWEETSSWSRAPGRPGMCPNATTPLSDAWRSPTSCAGNYCNASSSNVWNQAHLSSRVNAAYKNEFNIAATGFPCAAVTVTGVVETNNDRLVLYDAAGTVVNTRRVGNANIAGFTGSIKQTVRVCSSRVTAALETDGANNRSGVTVQFTPIR